MRASRRSTQLSKLGIPTITAAFGPNTAGGAYTPGMSDYTIFVKDAARPTSVARRS